VLVAVHKVLELELTSWSEMKPDRNVQKILAIMYSNALQRAAIYRTAPSRKLLFQIKIISRSMVSVVSYAKATIAILS
jgi:hypothetical protein